jgi:hypothetical protein
MNVVEKLIEEFLVSTDPRDRWHLPAARRWNFLPLYRGWWSTLGIRPDGSFVRWDDEDDPEVIKPLAEPFLQRLALCQGAKKHPELRALLPARPPEAITCEHCNGLGDMPGLPTFVCPCGGCGWIVPGESHGKNPG